MPTNAAPIALVRWLAGLSLLQTAESWIRRDADVSAASALIAADAASETLLSLLGSGSTRPAKALPPREELIARAQDVLAGSKARIEPATLADLRSTHSLRNNVVHHGARAGSADTRRACAVARDLAELLPKVSVLFAGVAPGGGVASAVATVVAVEDVADELRRGDQAMIADDADGVADAAGLALGRLLFYASPPLRLESTKSPFAARSRWDDRFGAQLVEDIDDVRGQLDELRVWVVAPSLGVSPAVYSRVVEVTGFYWLTTAGDQVSRRTAPSIADARWALERVSEMAFNLWQTDALAPRADRRLERENEVIARNRARQAEVPPVTSTDDEVASS